MTREEIARQYRHVNLYLTPLAIVIIASGLIVADLPFGTRVAGWSLLVYSVAANLVSVRFLDDNPQLIGSLRVVNNYVVNLVLLVLLYRSWPHVWLLVLLMSLASAVYGRNAESIAASAALVMTLLAAEWGLGDHSPRSWATVSVWCVSILAITRFVHGVSRRTRDDDPPVPVQAAPVEPSAGSVAE